MATPVLKKKPQEESVDLPLEKNTPSAKTKAVFWIMGWCFSFTIAMSIAKTLGPSVNSVVLTFMRVMFGFLLFSPFYLHQGVSVARTNRFWLHGLRVILSLASVGCTYYAYRSLPIAYATSIGQTGPLITTSLAILILKDKVPLKGWLVLIGGYLGVLIMVRPTEGGLDHATLIALLANIFAGCSIMTSKKLTHTESTLTMMFYSGSLMMALSSILVAIFWQTPTFEDMIKLSFMGSFGALSQYCHVNALKNASPSFLAPFEYWRLCIAIPIGLLFFDEIPTFWTLVGGLIIITSTSFLVKRSPPNSLPAKRKLSKF